MNKGLKPCPFCGGEAKKVAKEINGVGYLMVTCSRCGAGSPVFKATYRRTIDENNPAIKAWNTRKPMDEIVEKLDGTFDHWGLDGGKKDIMREIVKGGAE